MLESRNSRKLLNQTNGDKLNAPKSYRREPNCGWDPLLHPAVATWWTGSWIDCTNVTDEHHHRVTRTGTGIAASPCSGPNGMAVTLTADALCPHHPSHADGLNIGNARKPGFKKNPPPHVATPSESTHRPPTAQAQP
jgi:hypothetical protein